MIIIYQLILLLINIFNQFVTRKSEADISRLEAFVLLYHKKSSEKDRERAEISSKINGDVSILFFECFFE